MTDELATFLRDEIADLLDDAIRAADSDGRTIRSGARELVVVDDDGNRFLVTVQPAGVTA